MNNNIVSCCKRFLRREDGNMTIEFALAIPLVFTIFMTSVELGIYAVRQNFLDRGLDMAVREIRLSTGDNMTHNALKARVCEFAGFLPDCTTALRIEMNPVDPRAFKGFAGAADCQDVSEPITPSLNFVHGSEHQLMLLRACYMFKPVFPTSAMGRAFVKDGSGRVKMVSMSGFVQEPNT